MELQQIHDFDFSEDLVLGFLKFAEPEVLRKLSRYFVSKNMPKRINISGQDSYRKYIRYCLTFNVDSIEEVRVTFWHQWWNWGNPAQHIYVYDPIGWAPSSVTTLTVYSEYDNEIIIGENIKVLRIESTLSQDIVIPDNVEEIYLGSKFRGNIIKWPKGDYLVVSEEQEETAPLDYEWDEDDYDDPHLLW